MMAEAYPLYWPEGYKRTRSRGRSKFKTGFGAARNLLFAELGRMGASRIILSTSIPLRNDGLPRANTRPDGGDTGVAVYFHRKGKPMVLACDKYDRSEDNIYAIAKTIDAMRGIERWGSSEMLERAFTGFKALNSENDGESWWSILGCTATSSADEINAAYKAKIRVAHPDAGGSHEAMTRINIARDQALNERKEGQ
jgi:hypothetical protein